MTTENPERNKSRFIAEEEDIEIRGNKKPDPGQFRDAERVFGKILKDKRKNE